jgi:phosphopantothenoylcysteine decarboxylase / phosphopantothenate---cysteine ligase
VSLKVLYAVSGGIAAYKAPEVVRALTARGAEVRVIVTPAATAFVTELSLSSVSRHPVRGSLLDAAEEGRIGHIELATWPDVVLVAPATADLIARAAAGLADDLVTTCLLATIAPVLWAPAMNTQMWRHPATQANLGVLAARGATFVGPDRGELACGFVGEGRMIDPPIIAEAALALARARAGGTAAESWSGRRVLVSAGPTRAYLDPVRFLTNASTGVMGFALAEQAARAGAEVVLVAGPVSLATPPGVRRIDVETSEQMLAAMDAELAAASTDLVAMTAAVADLRPPHVAHAKVEKRDLAAAMAGWQVGVDVLATLVRRHGAHTFFLGFGAQTLADGEDPETTLVAAARRKLADKGCPAIFVNRVGVPDRGFASPTNTGWLVFASAAPDAAVPDGAVIDAGPPRPKAELARWILDRLAPRMGAPR